MKAVGGGIEAGVDRNGTLTQTGPKLVAIGRVVDQAASSKIVENVIGTHRGSLFPFSVA